MENLLLTIRKAMEYHRRIRIIYEKDGAFTERTIRPYQLKDNELHAYCYMRSSKRRFRLENIIGAVMLPEDEKGQEDKK
ncbi:MAG: WYL domain-containing protein [Christensenellaceae bacterium]|nr:WYL domain-containing protein [Christensenellaceae bacterium]